MQYELEEVKELRKKYGLTQASFAKLAGVSQSLIAKIEAKSIDPTYSKVQQIFKAIEELQKHHELAAEEVMQKKIILVHPHDSLKETIQKMKKYEISQLPVIDEQKVVGLISEASILSAFVEGKGEVPIQEVMGEAPPIIGKRSPIHIVVSLLKYYPLILVADGGKLEGLITKADVIRNMYA
ncbi:CBS domain-containing protein [Candidatus Woesearchaeota archaeon]|nr:CBS domain-containing protein [Candidatus Woesearchaeota archaeon]